MPAIIAPIAVVRRSAFCFLPNILNPVAACFQAKCLEAGWSRPCLVLATLSVGFRFDQRRRGSGLLKLSQVLRYRHVQSRFGGWFFLPDGSMKSIAERNGFSTECFPAKRRPSFATNGRCARYPFVFVHASVKQAAQFSTGAILSLTGGRQSNTPL